MASNEAAGPSAGLPPAPVVEDKQQQQQQPQSEINTAAADKEKRFKPNLPRRFLVAGVRANYLKTGVPLYEASIKCDWNAAKEILDKRKELVRYSITENGETALHVAASAKVPKLGEVFVKNLVDMMEKEDLELENENFNTALYLAAVAGNLETVKIMVEENRNLLTIPGAGRQMLPLYAAALFGNYDVVVYLFKKSNVLCKADGWNDINRRWLLEKCVENDMFDIALEIMKNYPGLGSGSVLALLARKPEAFHETESTIKGSFAKLGKHLHPVMFSTNQPSENKHPEPGNGSVPEEDLDQKPEASLKKKNIIWKTINSGKYLYSLMFVMHQPSGDKRPELGNEGVPPEDSAGKGEASNKIKSNIGRIIKSVFAFGGSKVEALKNESKAMQLLKIIWEDIAKRPKNEIDRILRGPPDLNKQEKSASDRVVQVMQLQKLISEHIHKMTIIKEQQDLTKQDTNLASGNPDEALNLRNLISENLVSMHIETHNIIKAAPDSIKQGSKPISGKADQALELQKVISENIVNMHDKVQKITEITGTGAPGLERLKKVISDHIENMQTETQKIIRRPAKETYSSRVLFIAAELGNTNFLIELIRRYPDLIWKVNDDKLSIFHIAVKHRHEGIYNLLYEIGSMKDLITPLKDPKDNNMLHLVGTIAKQKQLKDVSGAPLQMQRELLWFREVKDMIPPSYRERKNQDGLTPHELFTKEHKDLVSKGEEWMKGTANQCMVVAALIATIVFAAAFTVPGGYNQDNGIPIFRSKPTFIVFVVADAISLFSSSASILMFLSILTSRYAEDDFLESLPKKLILGLATLFLSITTMTVAFGVSFFVLYHKGMIWIPILICVFAVLPVLLYLWLQYGLFVDVIHSTYGSRYLFKPTKRVLYYQNPKV